MSHFTQLAYLYGEPAASAIFKTQPQDFQVTEQLGFELDGEGEHLCLWVQATDMSTDYSIRQLAKAFQIAPKNIGFCGKKDRRAQTRQWFSLYLPGHQYSQESLPSAIHENLQILGVTRHSKKLRRGVHRSNRFVIRLRNLQSFYEADFQQRLAHIKRNGFANYFGPQRFGWQENNLSAAHQVVSEPRHLKRAERDRLFSTLRAEDFNHYLSLRISEQTHAKALAGDLLMLAGSRSFFQAEQIDAEIEQRLNQHDLSVAGVLLGENAPQRPLATVSYQPDAQVAAFLSNARVDFGVRPLLVRPENIHYEYGGNELSLSFDLATGAYATSLLRELFNLQDRQT